MSSVTSRPTELPTGTPSREVVSELAEAFRRHDVPAVLLRAPGVDAGAAGAAVGDGTWRHDIDVLVPRSARPSADAALDELGWRIALGGRGAWRRIPTVSFHWDYAPSLDLHRGFPGGPLPPGALRRIGRILRERARPTACGLPAPDGAALAVFSAVQAARPGPFREMWVGDVAVHLGSSGPGEAERLARQLGVSSALRWATSPGAATLGSGRHASLFDGAVRRTAWSVANRARRMARPRRLGALLGGHPRAGTAVARSRFAGLELHSGPGAFMPQVVTEPMIDLALGGLPPSGGILVDVGTGVGAVALAVAKIRPDVRVIGCDVSEPGLRWAERNRSRLGLGNVRFLRGSLLDPLGEELAERVDVITGNVPYVPQHAFGDDYQDRDGAVLGLGPDGLDLQRELVRSSTAFLVPKGRLIVQSSIDQWELLATEMASWGFEPQPMAASSFEDAVCWGVADARTGRPFGLFPPNEAS
jgi:methylase of polypeptide subunit release factors